ncbi:MAG: metallopeptidase family protein [Myxococcaceae bacterium]
MLRRFGWSLGWVALVLGSSGCQRTQTAPANLSEPVVQTSVSPVSSPRDEVPDRSANPGPSSGQKANIPHAGHEHHVVPLAVCKSEGLDPLSAARKFYDDGRYEDALSCAAQSSAVTPEDPQAHSERAAALSALARFEEAQLAYARALAADPEHLDALLGAAHLYGVSLPSTRERDELASLYAEKGLALSESQGDHKLVAQFGLLSAMAFNDLGQAKDALERAEATLKLESKNAEARYERAVALFELCRFADAKAAFTQLLNDPQRAAHAHHHLGLILEREEKWPQADKHLALARKLSPEDFPDPQLLTADAFKKAVNQAVAELPADMRKDLTGIPVTAEELPKSDDLLSGEPPLSPAILGLFRGPPLGERCTADAGDPCRSVALYRRNLARAVRTRDELLEQIRVTLLHEVGHLRGEDDFELAARGLE